MSQIRPCGAKTQSQLSREWDQLAAERHRQISAGEDLSFLHVLMPMMLNLLREANLSLVVDVGSGTGDFTSQLARIASRVIGVEPSRASVAVAEATCAALPNVAFIPASVEEACGALIKESVSAVSASMTLMAAADLASVAGAVARLLPRGGKFVASLCHPYFWSRYWGYDSEPWFNYVTETFIEAPFSISRCRTGITTTHVHRPLATYVNVFADAGFRLEASAEPLPSAAVQALYPQPWRFPRFIGLRWVKGI